MYETNAKRRAAMLIRRVDMMAPLLVTCSHCLHPGCHNFKVKLFLCVVYLCTRVACRQDELNSNVYISLHKDLSLDSAQVHLECRVCNVRVCVCLCV